MRTRPNVISYNSAIDACRKGGRWEIAFALLADMAEISVTIATMTITIMTITIMMTRTMTITITMTITMTITIASDNSNNDNNNNDDKNNDTNKNDNNDNKDWCHNNNDKFNNDNNSLIVTVVICIPRATIRTRTTISLTTVNTNNEPITTPISTITTTIT